jgi:hypothetical protein
MRDVTVFGADSCEDTQRVLSLLTQLHVSHLYLNIERNPMANQLLRTWYPGAVRTPVVVMEGDGMRLAQPSDGQLISTLISAGLVDKEAA